MLGSHVNILTSVILKGIFWAFITEVRMLSGVIDELTQNALIVNNYI